MKPFRNLVKKFIGIYKIDKKFKLIYADLLLQYKVLSKKELKEVQNHIIIH